ncbi:MAG TPA: DUF3037 domain-containing protein [Candidatus Binatia bacterium]
MKTSYTFSVLRYVHDPVTGEFVNIGVALYARDAKYLSAICASHYQRLSQLFGSIDGEHFRQITRFIQSRIEGVGQRLKSELPFKNPPKNIEDVLAQVLPPDDSAIQFSSAGGGFTNDPGKTLAELYHRYVEHYVGKPTRPSRDDEEVWKVFKTPLEKRQVIKHLRPKRIVAPNYDYEFTRARKNEVWHAYEPVSFDLVEASSIKDKANNWLGRVTTLAESKDKFRLHLLLGGPRESHLQRAYVQAKNILHKMPAKPEFIEEDEAEEFADELKKEIEKHGE